MKWSDDFPSEESDVAFYGKCSRMILNGFSWPRMKCYNSDSYGPYLYQEDLPSASQNTAIISDIDWGCLRDSLAMTQLREAASSNNGKLQMRISTRYHTQNYPPFVARNATLGYIVGVIGVANENDTDNIPGERGLFFKDQPIGLKYDTVEGDLCFNKSLYDFGNWSNFAPSMVDYERNEVRVDLSNSIPTDMSNTLRSIGTLRLGVLLGSCVLLVGNESAEGIPYSSPADLPITSAIYTVRVDSSLMDELASDPLVVVQMVPDGQGNSAICTGSIGGPEPHTIQIILEEFPVFVRPTGFYSLLLDRNYNNIATQTVYATKYGKAMVGLPLNVNLSPLNGPPAEGVVAVSMTAVTDSKGLATFEFTLKDKIPLLRHYKKAPCADSAYPDNRTTDGQVYFWYYCPSQVSIECYKYAYVSTFTLGFSDVEYTKPYTWVKDVGPIFMQYARLAPTMKGILDLSNYDNVTQSHNLNLLNRTFRLDIDHVSHMPTTRDLSPTKRAMILEWLDNPQYDEENTTALEQSHICKPIRTNSARPPDYFCAKRCGEELNFKDHQSVTKFSMIISLT